MKKRWDEEQIKELKDPQSWDDSKIEVLERVKKPRAVVSVAFSRDDFELVAGLARNSGMTTSGYIREAALDMARASAKVISIQWGGNDGGSFFVQLDPAPSTQVMIPVEQF